MTSLRRAPRPILSLFLAGALLHPTLAQAATARASGRLPSALPASKVGGAVQAHPVIDVINQLQTSGVALPETLTTRADVGQARAAAAALPPGELRGTIERMAAAADATLAGGSADGAKLHEAFENASAKPQGTLERLASRPWMPAGLARLLAPAPKSKPIDPGTREIPVERLRWTPALEQVPEEGTRAVEADDRQIVGQDLALKAIYFGLKMPNDRYNLFVSGPEGSGRATAVRHIAEELAATMPVPEDKVAVTNLEDPKKPEILSLPTGSAARFSKALKQFVAAYQLMLPQALRSPQVRAMQKDLKQQLEGAVKQRQAEFDAEVAQAQLPGGKYGMKIAVLPLENGGVRVLPIVTYKDAQSGEFKTPESEEQLEQLFAGGALVKSEWQQAVKDSQEAAKPFYEKFRAMVEQNQADEAAMEKELEQLTEKVAKNVVQQIAGPLVASVMKNRHDTPEHKEFDKRAAGRLQQLAAEAASARLGQYGVALVQTDGGFMFMPTRMENGKPDVMAPEEIQAKLASGELTEAAVDRVLGPLYQKLQSIAEANEKEHKALHVNDAPPGESEKEAIGYVQRLLAHAVEHHASFLPPDPNAGQQALMERMRNDASELYRVSVLVDNSELKGAPVIFDDKPKLETSFGKVESNTKALMLGGGKMAQFDSPGGPTLEAGLFQKAHGGFYVVDVMQALKAPGYWQTLMEAVSTGAADIIGLNPQAGELVRYGVPSKVKVVLIGSPMIKMLLAQNDETFARTFRASADFEPTLGIGPRSIQGNLQFMKNVIAKHADEMLDFTREGVMRVLAESARMADSNEKFTAQFGRVFSLMQRAVFWAKEAGAKLVGAEHVSAALQAHADATQGGERRLLDAYRNGSMKINVAGRQVGQINGLAVMGTMGVPLRVTAVSGRGQNGGARYPDREAGFTGQLFNKAIGVVDGFLLRELGRERPIRAQISVSYEQSYGGIDGDSATSTEAYAILSALSGIPIRQDLAVTGSMDQNGNVQGIGGANEKTEGFFKVASALANDAKRQGFNGVLIPESNEKNLQLDPAVVEAAREGRFKVYSIRTIKEGWEILTGVPFEEAIRRAKRTAAR